MGEIAHKNAIEAAEEQMLAMPQADCPVRHIFHDGVYIREVLLRAGMLVIGHHHKDAQINIMLTGRMIVATDSGAYEMSAPQTYIGPEGRKAVYILEDVLWQNVYATNETDIEKLEDMFVDKSQAFLQVDEIKSVKKRLGL